jgi:hypothetical protein
MITIEERFGLENHSLLECALTHHSVMSNELAREKFGTSQDELASIGICKFFKALDQYLKEIPTNQIITDRLTKDKSFYLWANWLCITHLFNTNDCEDTHEKIAAVFIMALIELVHQVYGTDTTYIFLKYNFFDKIDYLYSHNMISRNLHLPLAQHE